MAIDVTVLSMAKKVGCSSIVDASRACSNRRNRKNKHNYGESESIGRACI